MSYRIHLKDRNGIYTIVSKTHTTVTVTCNRWNALANYPKQLVTKTYPIDNIKCLEGVPGIKKHRQNIKDAKTLLYLMRLIYNQKHKCNA